MYRLCVRLDFAYVVGYSLGVGVVGTDPLQRKGFAMWTEQNNRQRAVEVRAAIAAARESHTEEEDISAAEANTERGGKCLLVVVPAAFWNDHTSRDLDFGTFEVRSSRAEWGNYDDGSYVVLVMEDEGFRELVDDASHYSNSFDEAEYGALAESARRTIVALWQQHGRRMRELADARTSYGDLAWALGIENRRKGAIITG